MMSFKVILFWQFLVQSLGINARIDVGGDKQKVPLALDHSWEAQHFTNKDSLVEGESDADEFLALRERRDTAKRSVKSVKRSANQYEGISGSGDICETNLHDCHPNATCLSVNSSMYTCTCNDGFSGEGKMCKDIDECSTGTHHCHANKANCTNSHGSYNCFCDQGYAGDGGNCKDINECKLDKNPCSLNAQCNNTIGSFKCTCNQTFYGDGKICTELRSDYSSRNVYTKPGDPAVLVCTLNQTVQWKKDGNILRNNDKIKIFQNVLVINSIDDEDYGEYFCELQIYKGKGIKMSLIKINADNNKNGEGDSNTFLILFIIVFILFVVALLVIVYLLLRRKPKSATTIQRLPAAGENKYGKPEEMHMSGMGPSGVAVEENYDSLTDIREKEPEYQGLTFVNRGKKDPAKDDENIYAEAS